jgi:hypothetical protein
MTEIRDLTQAGAVVNGMLASFCNISITHPLFTIKTAYMSKGGSFPKWNQLYLGYRANLVCDMSCQVVNFYGFHLYSKTIMESKTLTNTERCVGGVFAGTLSSIALCYCERIMVLNQRAKLKDPKTEKILSAWRTTKHLFSLEGKRAFVKGMLPTALRESINSACFFGVSEMLKGATREVFKEEKIASATAFFIAGALSGAITTPFDLVKTRMQLGIGSNMSFKRVVIEILQEEGKRALFITGLPARALTLACTSAILGPISEVVRNNLPEGLKKT